MKKKVRKKRILFRNFKIFQRSLHLSNKKFLFGSSVKSKQSNLLFSLEEKLLQQTALKSSSKNTLIYLKKRNKEISTVTHFFLPMKAELLFIFLLATNAVLFCLKKKTKVFIYSNWLQLKKNLFKRVSETFFWKRLKSESTKEVHFKLFFLLLKSVVFRLWKKTTTKLLRVWKRCLFEKIVPKFFILFYDR